MFPYLDVFSCADLKRSGYAQLDGEYLLYPVQSCSYPIAVYCHGMDTDSPKDYLPLPAGPINNYAIVYDKRLPFVPTNARYQCDGQPGNIRYSKTGVTRFTKVSMIMVTFRKIHTLLFMRAMAHL